MGAFTIVRRVQLRSSPKGIFREIGRESHDTVGLLSVTNIAATRRRRASPARPDTASARVPVARRCRLSRARARSARRSATGPRPRERSTCLSAFSGSRADPGWCPSRRLASPWRARTTWARPTTTAGTSSTRISSSPCPTAHNSSRRRARRSLRRRAARSSAWLTRTCTRSAATFPASRTEPTRGACRSARTRLIRAQARP